MDKFAIIVAGGSGQRMGSETPKQFLLLKGQPIVHHTLKAFVEAFDDIRIILVLPKEHLAIGEKIIDSFQTTNKIQLTSGGKTRFQSVKNGLQFVTHPSIVFVHDGVRCLVTKQLIRNCYDQALAKGSAIPAIIPSDSMRMTKGDTHQTINREDVRIIQTPQTFMSEIIIPAFEQDYSESFTDEATVAEAAGNQVYLIEGEYSNIKITRPIDLCIAENLIDSID